ncbi:MAG TPA: OmpA family protein [Paenalcaligenes sp.]|nr:OmpA family protein [Paenalcaligenes sp.]
MLASSLLRWFSALFLGLSLVACAQLGLKPNDTIILDSDVLFDFGQAELKPEGKRQIEQYVPLIKARGKTWIEVVGHTDRIGSKSTNDRLSMERAESVRQILIANGLNPDRIRARGLGSRSPKVECPDQARDALIECLAPNRRVVIDVRNDAW